MESLHAQNPSLSKKTFTYSYPNSMLTIPKTMTYARIIEVPKKEYTSISNALLLPGWQEVVKREPDALHNNTKWEL